jgi:hypothetical protein
MTGNKVAHTDFEWLAARKKAADDALALAALRAEAAKHRDIPGNKYR